ncbi:hypothetical protein JTE90_022396 [Oedothorax gibbosus]|uniref:C-factor n=1 Tax=Oedothorax gibbosus TaxID=931172 RepID=A0AAV6U307_9ARAC|nr:hypothetical protein JTE90_022396 [Oedothorax gibbosus]
MKIGSVLVTGANRGIGLEFVRQFSQLDDAPDFIFATYRSEKTVQELNEIKEKSKSRMILIKMDVTVLEEIKASKKKIEELVGDRGLNLLINNAGVMRMEGFPNITSDGLEFIFKSNTVSCIMVTQVMFPLLETAASKSGIKGMSMSKAAVLNMTSKTGSIQDTGVKFVEDLIVPGYKISKAALNMGMRIIAAEVKDKNILVVNMCPGWVKTDMGDRNLAEIEPEVSIGDILETLPKLGENHHGSYTDRFGQKYPY